MSTPTSAAAAAPASAAAAPLLFGVETGDNNADLRRDVTFCDYLSQLLPTLVYISGCFPNLRNFCACACCPRCKFCCCGPCGSCPYCPIHQPQPGEENNLLFSFHDDRQLIIITTFFNNCCIVPIIKCYF